MAIGSLANLDGVSFYINEDDMKAKGISVAFYPDAKYSAHFSSDLSCNTE